MSLNTIITYCTQTDVEHYLSMQGVICKLDDDRDGEANAFETQRMTDCIINASETINFHAASRYDPAQLATSNLVNRWATKLAGYDLCSCRGGPVPDAVIEQAEKAEERLELIAKGQRYLPPDIPLRRNMVPTYDNIRCLPGYRFKVIRVETRTSSQQPTTRPENVDYANLYTFEI